MRLYKIKNLLKGGCNSRSQIQEDREISGIRMHDVKPTKNQWKLKINGEPSLGPATWLRGKAPSNLSSISETHTVEGETASCKLSSNFHRSGFLSLQKLLRLFSVMGWKDVLGVKSVYCSSKKFCTPLESSQTTPTPVPRDVPHYTSMGPVQVHSWFTRAHTHKTTNLF